MLKRLINFRNWDFSKWDVFVMSLMKCLTSKNKSVEEFKMANEKIKQLIEKAFPYSNGEDRIDEAQKAIDFVRDLAYEILQHDKINEPNATRSHYEMELVVSRLGYLDDYIKIDPNVQRVMEAFNLEENQVNELVEHFSCDIESVVASINREDIHLFEDKREMFNHAHRDCDTSDLLHLMWNEESHLMEENYYEMDSSTFIYWEEGSR
jgi:hypothetical protein